MAAKFKSPISKTETHNPLSEYNGLRTSKFVSIAEAGYFIKWAEGNIARLSGKDEAYGAIVQTAIENAQRELEELRNG